MGQFVFFLPHCILKKNFFFPNRYWFKWNRRFYLGNIAKYTKVNCKVTFVYLESTVFKTSCGVLYLHFHLTFSVFTWGLSPASFHLCCHKFTWELWCWTRSQSQALFFKPPEPSSAPTLLSKTWAQPRTWKPARNGSHWNYIGWDAAVNITYCFELTVSFQSAGD